MVVTPLIVRRLPYVDPTVDIFHGNGVSAATGRSRITDHSSPLLAPHMECSPEWLIAIPIFQMVRAVTGGYHGFRPCRSLNFHGEVLLVPSYDVWDRLGTMAATMASHELLCKHWAFPRVTGQCLGATGKL